MIVYHHDKAGFCADVETGDIDRILLDKVRGTLGIGVSPSEVRSWHQSLTHMHLVPWSGLTGLTPGCQVGRWLVATHHDATGGRSWWN